MVPERPDTQPAADRGAASVEDGNEANRGLRAVLALGFGGLLLLLLYSGANALQTLRRLHETEESAHTRSLQRQRVLATSILSANIYSDHVEEFLLSSATPEDATEEITKGAAAAREALQAYPADRSAEEQSLLEQLQAYLTEQETAFRSAHGRKSEGRLVRGQRVVSDEIIPRRQRFVAVAQRIELLNDNQTLAANHATFLEFGRLQDRLKNLLILALTSGLLLAVGSVIYILRLERQARLRYAELVESRRDLQQLSTKLVDAQETERRSLSRELHDEVAQALGLLLMDVGQLSNQFSSGEEKRQELVQRIKSVAERAVQTVRNMALLLRPSMLDDLGLLAAVEWYARETSRRGEIEVEVHSENVSEDLGDELKLCVYRIVQEALNNAQRHSHARTARVELTQTNGAIRVKIADEGRGFDPKRTRGMGLLGMEERVKRLGGALTIESRPGAGTTIRVELPLTRG
jgi:signal transduction histidine kinase